MFLTIVLAAVAGFVFGFLWYGPVFGKVWMKLSNMSPDQMSEGAKEGMAMRMVLAALVSLVSAYVVASLIPAILPLSYGEFMKWVTYIWLGFNLPVQMYGYLWEKKSWMLVCFNSVASLLTFWVMSAVVYFV
jgi:hypothetical protein